VEWLTESQQAAWRALILTMQRLDETLDRQLQRDAGMPHAYYAVLVALSERPHRIARMGDLAAEMCFSQSRLSHAISKMEQAGWVRRRPDPDDRRGTLAVLTDAGYRVLQDAAPGHVQCVRESVFDRLTQRQVNQLRLICEAILK
jgi:DNA-binding MarR family transcriptional regulator